MFWLSQKRLWGMRHGRHENIFLSPFPTTAKIVENLAPLPINRVMCSRTSLRFPGMSGSLWEVQFALWRQGVGLELSLGTSWSQGTEPLKKQKFGDPNLEWFGVELQAATFVFLKWPGSWFQPFTCMPLCCTCSKAGILPTISKHIPDIGGSGLLNLKLLANIAGPFLHCSPAPRFTDSQKTHHHSSIILRRVFSSVLKRRQSTWDKGFNDGWLPDSISAV